MQLLAAQAPLDLASVFYSAPIIYTLLAMMSVASMGVWLYSLASFREKDICPSAFKTHLKELLRSNEYEKAELLCEGSDNLLSNLIITGLRTRQLGSEVMLNSMKSEGKLISAAFFQRLAFLNDIVVIAPMLGLLGTVIGMFYAFYDVNRSMESINALFDGLGIAVGTTVAGLIVAILSMVFHTTLKYRIIRSLSAVENEALHLSSLIRR